MPIKYKINVMDALKQAGFTTYRIRQEKLIGERALQQIRSGELCSWAVMAKICEILKCQPGDIVEYKDTESIDEAMERDNAQEIKE